MKAPRFTFVIGLALVVAVYLGTAEAQTAPAAPQSDLQKKIDRYLRHVYALGSDVKLIVPEPTESEVPGLLVTTVELVSEDSKDTAKMYVSKDGRFLLRGDVADMSKNPMAENAAKKIGRAHV